MALVHGEITDAFLHPPRNAEMYQMSGCHGHHKSMKLGLLCLLVKTILTTVLRTDRKHTKV